MLRVLLVLAVSAVAVHARGAGRAFPIDSENYVIEEFQNINRFLEWDETNFLVDLSGQYANCDNIGRRGGAFVNVEKFTPEGGTISAYVDDVAGRNTDVNAVNGYIRDVIDTWTKSGYGSSILGQIRNADRFGCSVRPGCSGRVSVACLFTPGSQGDQPDYPNDSTGKVHGRAFTLQQYAKAEDITHKEWDRDNTLENLAGTETTCNLIYEKNHQYPYAAGKAQLMGMKVLFLYGDEPNTGETEPPMLRILQRMKKPSGAKKVGCAIIPDCETSSGMTVVVGCLYQMA